MPRPSSHGRRTPVIPAGWADAAAPTIGDTIARAGCTVTIGPAGGAPAWNPTTKITEAPDTAAVYTGPAELEVVTPGSKPADIVDQPTGTTLYLVRLPVDQDTATALIRVGHVISVTTSPDPRLEGATLHVQSVEDGTRRFSRLIYATLIN